MIDRLKQDHSIRRICCVLGFRRASYYHRKQGHRPEEVDLEIATLLGATAKKHVSWGFWMIFHVLGKQGYSWNHKRVWRVWKSE